MANMANPAVISRLHACLRTVATSPPRLIASPPPVKGGASQKRASVAISES